MVVFDIGDVRVYFPYDFVYPEQLAYMQQLKATLDARGHCVLEMPTGTGKTVALLSLITSYQLARPEIGKLLYCTRTVPEMEKALQELKLVVDFQRRNGGDRHRNRRTLGMGMSARRNLCIHESISREVDRDKLDERCTKLTAPWIRRKRLLAAGDTGGRPEAPGVAGDGSGSSATEERDAPGGPAGAAPAGGLGTAANAPPTVSRSGSSAENCPPACPDAAGAAGPTGGPAAGAADIEDSPLPTCRYYENYESMWSPSLIPAGVYTIDDMKILGAEYAVEGKPQPFCPYFASRRLVQIANVIVLNYQYVLDPKVSQAIFVGGLAPAAGSFGAGGNAPGGGKRRGSASAAAARAGAGSADGGAGASAGSAAGAPAASAAAADTGAGFVAEQNYENIAAIAKASAKDGDRDGAAAADPSVIVFDEAHNIDNVCIEAFSINLSMITLQKAKQCVTKLRRLVHAAKTDNQERLVREYDRLVRNLRAEGQLDEAQVDSLANPVLPEDIVKDAVPGTIRRAEFFLVMMNRLILFLSTYIRVFQVKTEGPLTFLKRVNDEVMVDTKSLKFCYERLKSLLTTLEVTDLENYAPLTLTANFFTLLGTYWEGFIVITDPYPEAEGIYEPVVQLACLDSSLAMRPVLRHFQSVILTSGTISPLFLYPRLLGFSPVITQSFPMSLDRQCICPLIIVKGADQVPLSSRFDLRGDAAVLRNFGNLLVELARTVPDGVVCFFTSYAFMEVIVAEWYGTGVLSEVMKHKLILMETKDVVATTLALHAFRHACDAGRGAVFFSVARGKVAEGIDFDRHYGRAVVLFGVPYQFSLSRVLKARLDYLRENYQVPDNEFLTFDAMRQAAQCIGRVIRSKTDYGLMILADARYARADKRSKLPEWVLRHLDPAHTALSADVALSVARRFLLEMSQPLVVTNKSRLDQRALDAAVAAGGGGGAAAAVMKDDGGNADDKGGGPDDHVAANEGFAASASAATGGGGVKKESAARQEEKPKPLSDEHAAGDALKMEDAIGTGGNGISEGNSGMTAAAAAASGVSSEGLPASVPADAAETAAVPAAEDVVMTTAELGDAPA